MKTQTSTHLREELINCMNLISEVCVAHLKDFNKTLLCNQ